MVQKLTRITYLLPIEKMVILKEILEPQGLTITKVLTVLFDQLINNTAHIDNGMIVSDEIKEMEERRRHLEKVTIDHTVYAAFDSYPSSYKKVKEKKKLSGKKETARRTTNRKQMLQDRAKKILEQIKLEQETENKRYTHDQT